MLFFMKYLSLGLFINSIPYVVMIIILKYYYDKRRLFMLGNRLPGPRPWPIIGNALEFLPKNVDVLSKLTEFNRKYGLSSFWLGHILAISVCSPEDAEICFKSPHLRKKAELYKFFEPIAGKGLFTAHGMQFEKPKKLMEPFFNNLSVQKYTDIYIEKANVLLQCLEKEEGSQPFLIYPYVKKCTFDIICESILSIRFNAQQERLEPLEDAEAIFCRICDRIFSVWQHPDFIYKLSPQGKDFSQRIDRFKNFVESIIEELEAMSSKESSAPTENGEEGEIKNIFVQKLMKSGEFTDEELRDQLTTIIAGGFEPTALATSFILMMLGIHKDVQEKLYAEISSAFKNGLNEKDLYQLKYLEMVIKETLRLYPPIPYIGRKVDQDVQMGQHLIPKGAEVAVNISAIHRNPTEYENPETFNPDNFLPENIEKRHSCSYVPFAMGNRKCIGGKFAMLSLRIIISKIVLKYKIDCDLKLEDIKVKNRIFSEPENGFIRIIHRQS